ncbi:MAG: potassium/proton antiporter [Acidimicrobiia bacterium]|jgi:cell volume regulation protein A|nr:potassium/proton antiporter [Acidimicrobiia bacterium]
MTLDHLPVESVLLVAAGLMVIGVLIVGASDRLRVPAALLSLGIGILFGSDVLGLVEVSDMAMVRDISVIALMIILFEGGLTTKPSVLRESGVPGFVLANVGVLVTAGVVATGWQLLFDTGWETALIIGAVVASTDAAVVFDVVRRTPIPKRLAGILEIESGVNDPFAILLTIGLIEVTRSSPGIEDWLVFGARQLFGGIAVGLLGGWIGSRLLRLRLRSSGLYPLLALAMAGLTFAVASYVGSSGFLAVYICGLMIGALAPRHRRVVRSFHASLANGADIALFLLLGLLVFPAELPGVAIPALAVTAILLLVGRPLSVVLAMLPFRLSWKEMTFLSWAGLRGALPIVLATFPATAGVAAGETIFNLVFFVVVVSALLQGTTIGPLAKRLGLVVDRPAWQSIAEAVELEDVDVDLIEIEVTDDLALVGTRLSENPPPEGMLITTMIRDHKAAIPTPDTVFASGDFLMLAVNSGHDRVREVTAWARGETRVPDDTGTAS